MMPGSLINKTTTDLSNMACLHSTIADGTDVQSEYVMDFVCNSEISHMSTEVKHLEVQNDVELSSPEDNLVCNVNETMQNKSTKIDDTSRRKSKIDKKIKRFLKKYGFTTADLTKLKKLKRQTREKRKQHRVLSFKLKRCYPINVKFKWATGRVPAKKSVKKQKEFGSNSASRVEYTRIEDNDDMDSEKGDEPNPSLLPIISNFRTDDDIRDKIKHQLELLRSNRKVANMCNVEREHDVVNNDVVVMTETSRCVVQQQQQQQQHGNAMQSVLKRMEPQLSDVLLSNEGELSIVSVVGGYIDDVDDLDDERNVTEVPCLSTMTSDANVNSYGCCIGKRSTTMTDILLNRELSLNKEDPCDLHRITPKKTNDITKIKGWKSKQFDVTNNLFRTIVQCEYVNEEERPVDEVGKQEEEGSNCVSDNELPSTSSGVVALDSKKITSDINLPDNILKQGENLTSDNNSKSVFESDILDTFLNNHAELKISYEVPKLVAEEAITKPASEMPVACADYLVVNKRKMYAAAKRHKNNRLKPKTLAEKRKMLELDRQKHLLREMEVTEDDICKKLENCDKRSKRDTVKTVRKNLIHDGVPFSRHCWDIVTSGDDDTQQYAFVNGVKIRITGSMGGQDLVVKCLLRTTLHDNNLMTDDTSELSKNNLNNVSNLSLKQQSNVHIKRSLQYKPGPLSKKRKLLKDIASKENWECHVLKMPKIKLVVYPEVGKRVPPLAEKYLQLCRNEEGYISNEWAKFAVSVVRYKEEEKKTQVELPLPYANLQNKLLVRKRTYKQTTSTTTKQFTNIDVKDEIRDIMSEMLDCIDNQSLDEMIIKEDPDLSEYSRKSDAFYYRPPSPVNSMVRTIIKRPNVKRSKTTLELRRLNVQVIEVDVKEEEESDKMNCTNLHCRLGCVCRSGGGGGVGVGGVVVPEHCGREQCMLECTCSYGFSQRSTRHSITLPAGTDLLSASTVVRLQDQVQRNLAKEERKFTQTVIKANNQTIMVGDGTTDRQRRVSKVPKKYSNYLHKPSKGLSYLEMISNGLLEDAEDPDYKVNSYLMQKVENKPPGHNSENVSPRIIELKKPVPIWIKDQSEHCTNQMKRVCRVQLEQIQLNNVVPWCMVHNLYNCHCGGRAEFESKTHVKPKTDEEQIIYSNSNKTEDSTTEACNEYVSYASRFANRNQVESTTSAVTTLPDVTRKYCARTRALGTNYYQARNKSQRFKARFAKMREEDQKCDFNKVANDDNDIKPNNQNDNLQNTNRLCDLPDANVEKTYSKHRKNNTMIELNHVLNSDSVLKQQQQECGTTIEKSSSVSAASLIDYDRSFMGILTPSEEWLNKFHKMLNLNNTVIHQIRLLEWATLVKRQKNGSLQMWFNSKRYNNVIMTEDRKRPSRSHMNIKLFKNTPLENFNVPDIITSIFNNKLPGLAKKATETYVILVYNGTTWEARGTIVLNNTSEMCKTRLAERPTPVTILNTKSSLPVPVSPASSNNNNTTMKQKDNPSLLLRSTPSMSVELVNNNKCAPKSSADPIAISGKGVEITKILPATVEPTATDASKKPGNILVPLPTGLGWNRWFMLTLENDFSVLRISFSNFHIKYTHLRSAILMANNNKKTVRIRSQDNAVPESAGGFGVYATPDLNDRIFFGPYDTDAEHGLETFRYINGKLVNTKIYNKMRGSTERKTTGMWYLATYTYNNHLCLEPQLEDYYSSSSECSTEMTSAENAVKPQIEFVDLTGNDSDNEDAHNKTSIDPLFNVLAADFSRKISNDITIEPVCESPHISQKVPSHSNESNNNNNNNNKKVDVVIQSAMTKVNMNTNTKQVLSNRNAKVDNRGIEVNATSVLAQESEPIVIDSINLDLDEDDEMPVIEPYYQQMPSSNSTDSNCLSNVRQMPELYPINDVRPSRQEALRNKKPNKKLLNSQNVIYLITNIPGVGYFEIVPYKKKYQLRITIKNKPIPAFLSLQNAISWLELIFHKYIYIMPVNLKISFSTLESKQLPTMAKFNENYLNGFHMVCEKGLFDLLRMSTNEIDELGFSESDSAQLLAHKCELLINRNIKIMGNFLVGPEECRKMDRNSIMAMAPHKIKIMQSLENYLVREKGKLLNNQQKLLQQINSYLKHVPEVYKKSLKKNVDSILRKKSNHVNSKYDNFGHLVKSSSHNNVPGGQTCKPVIAPKPVLNKPYPVNLLSAASMQSLLQTGTTSEMIVPITGLQTPVTVLGVVPHTTKSLLNSNQTTSSTKYVDLTDDY